MWSSERPSKSRRSRARSWACSSTTPISRGTATTAATTTITKRTRVETTADDADAESETGRVSRGGLIKAVTVDCWGTLLLDSPSSDERYARRRLAGINSILTASGIEVRDEDLSRAYIASGQRLARIWADCRDVPVRHYVRMLLEALDPLLPQRLSAAVFDEMIEAYAGAALLAPPAIDPEARAVLEGLAVSGITLGVVSNTMRTPGVALRRI